MGLFEDQSAGVAQLREQWRGEGRLNESNERDLPRWPAGSSVVLSEDAALELGNPAIGSLLLLLWTDRTELVNDGRIGLVGPDLREIGPAGAPLGLVLLVRAEFADQYQGYLRLRDALYGVRLHGLTSRSIASRGTAWFRLSHDALQRGLSLPLIGAELIRGLRSGSEVSAVEALLVTAGRSELAQLRSIADAATRVCAALIKMNEEPLAECEGCEFWDVCQKIEELKRMRSANKQRATP